VVHGTGGAFLATNTLSFFAVLAMIILILKYRDKEKNNSMEGK
jgi:hypothetical protein